MSSKERESVKELLQRFKDGIYEEYQFYWPLARRACTDGWNEVLTELPPDELEKFRSWVRRSFRGPGVKMLVVSNVQPPPYSAEQEEFLFRWGREGVEDNKDGGDR